MSIVNIVKEMKKIYPNDLVLIKVGKFYHAYGKDSYILSYLFNYQIKKVEQNTNTCDFPEIALNNVLNNLEGKSINYLVMEKNSNYEVTKGKNFNDNNMYIEVYNSAYKYFTKKNRIDAIHEYFMDNINDDIIKIQIQKVEEIIYETR